MLRSKIRSYVIIVYPSYWQATEKFGGHDSCRFDCSQLLMHPSSSLSLQVTFGIYAIFGDHHRSHGKNVIIVKHTLNLGR